MDYAGSEPAVRETEAADGAAEPVDGADEAQGAAGVPERERDAPATREPEAAAEREEEYGEGEFGEEDGGRRGEERGGGHAPEPPPGGEGPAAAERVPEQGSRRAAPAPARAARSSEEEHGFTGAPVSTKIVVAGGFGVGKTTFVGSVSEIEPLRTEALMTQAGESTDDLAAVPDKTTTTVAMDFGRITLASDLVLYLFGTPGQQRFWFMWDDVARGAIGAVVMVDTRRLEECFPALDYFESCGLPYAVAVNHFEGTPAFTAEDVREALSVPDGAPVVVMDARDQGSVFQTLLSLVGHALDAAPA